jgi:hypothetical protein
MKCNAKIISVGLLNIAVYVYVLMADGLERLGVDLPWHGVSTAHDGKVWPHHIIISILFVTAVCTVCDGRGNVYFFGMYVYIIFRY